MTMLDLLRPSASSAASVRFGQSARVAAPAAPAATPVLVFPAVPATPFATDAPPAVSYRSSAAPSETVFSGVATAPAPSLNPFSDIDESTVVAVQWHVAVTRPGLFPMSEARCPCEKAPCGLVIVRQEIECAIHHTWASLHQAHASGECQSGARKRAAARRGFMKLRQRQAW